jgi:hypothetical protein
MAFKPPVSATNGTMGPSRAARARSIAWAVSNEPVKATPCLPGMAHQRRADLSAVADDDLENGRRNARFVENRDGAQAHQRRLLGRLGYHRVAGRQRGGDLAGEDRQREVPRADAGERAAADSASALPAGPGRLRRGEIGS